jgi:pimeloyl-ACP methyl ester carboxylesterase
VILAHGLSGNGMCWRRVADELAQRFDVTAYDARSHGKSSDGRPLGGVDVVAVVEALGLAPVIAIGHSMGASAIGEAAADRPDLFRAAVFEDPPWMSSERRTEVATIIRDAMASTAREGDADMISMYLQPPADPVDAADWLESKQQFRAFKGLGDLDALSAPWQEHVRRLDCPALLLWGTRGMLTAETVDEAHHLAPDLRDVCLDAGHEVRRDAFPEYIEAVQSFLETVVGAPDPDGRPSQ